MGIIREAREEIDKRNAAQARLVLSLHGAPQNDGSPPSLRPTPVFNSPGVIKEEWQRHSLEVYENLPHEDLMYDFSSSDLANMKWTLRFSDAQRN